MARPPDPRRTQLIGLVVAIVSAVGIVGLYAFATGDPYDGEEVTITAHFSSVSGLKKGSDVRLAGKLVGRVDNVAFVSASYACDPATEDVGRNGTDACEPWTFCAPTDDGGSCAELMPYTGAPSDYADKGCIVQQLCKDTEVCFNDSFRSAHPDVSWYGPNNTCVPFTVDHQRVEVRMAIHADKLRHISRDSTATIASKGAVGDQQINIDYGGDEPIEPGGRLQSKPTLLQELNEFRERVSAATGRFSENLDSLRELRGSMASAASAKEPTDMRSNLARLADTTHDIATHQGQLGELFQADSRDDAITQLQDLRAASDQARRDIVAWRREATPKLRNLSQDMDEFARSAHAAADPSSDTTASKLLTDERYGLDIAERTSRVSESIGSTREKLGDVHEDVLELRRQLRAGEGTLGELVRDPDLYYSFVKAIAMFDLFDRNDAFKSMVRSVIAAGDDYAHDHAGADAAIDRAPEGRVRPPTRAPTPTDTGGD